MKNEKDKSNEYIWYQTRSHQNGTTSKRIVEDYNDIKLADKTINFEHANKVLEDERKKASEYLDKALND